MALSNISNPLGGGAGASSGIIAGGTLYGLNGQTITGNSSGAWAITANGTNQSITLTPSGTGGVLVGTAVNSSALLQLGTNTTTSAGGMVFGTDTYLYRNATGALSLMANTGSEAFVDMYAGATRLGYVYFSTTNAEVSNLRNGSIMFKTNAVTALTLDASQNATFAAKVVLKGYTVATLPAATTGAVAYVTDANATTYNSTVAGGGANVVKVFYNGTNWVIA